MSTEAHQAEQSRSRLFSGFFSIDEVVNRCSGQPRKANRRESFADGNVRPSDMCCKEMVATSTGEPLSLRPNPVCVCETQPQL